MRRLLFVLPLLLVACFPFRRGEGITADDLIVCVRNDLAASGNIQADIGTARYDVIPGTTMCRRVTATTPQGLVMTARTIGGGAMGPLTFAEALPSTNPGCWVWRIGPGTSDAVSPIDCSEVGEVEGISSGPVELPRLAADGAADSIDGHQGDGLLDRRLAGEEPQGA